LAAMVLSSNDILYYSRVIYAAHDFLAFLHSNTLFVIDWKVKKSISLKAYFY
jgi:hypothetical protein